MRPARWNLATRLLVPILLVGTLIVVVIALTGYLTTRGALADAGQAQARTLAERASLAIDNDLSTLAMVPQIIAASELRSPSRAGTLEQYDRMLRNVLERLPIALNTYIFFEKQAIAGRDYAEVWYRRENGVIAPAYSNFPGEQGYDPTKELYDYHATEWYMTGRGAQKTVWMAPYFDAAANAVLVSAVTRVERDGALIGVAGVDLSLETTRQIVQNVQPTANSYAVLVDNNGRFLANPSAQELELTKTIADQASAEGNTGLARLAGAIASGQDGLLQLNDTATGEPVWAAYQTIPSTGWHVVIFIPEADMLAGVAALQWRFLALGLAGLAVLAMLAFLLARSISRPVQRLAVATARMADGDLSTRVPIDRTDEVGLLGTSFNQMSEALAVRIQAEEEARTTAQQAQQAEAEGRAAVERTVVDYLQFVQHVAQGDLTSRLTLQGQGALAQLGEGLNGMVANLHQMTSQIREANAAIASAAAEILAATTQQAASAAEQSAAIAQTTTTVEEVKMIAVQTSQQAQQVARDSQSALDMARQGTQAVEETVSSMGQIRGRVQSIAQTILGLAEQTQTISAITQTVTELADQSNLLALNAAIEAARAGEQGRSFAVVAQHVRELAERSKAATGQVGQILGEIQRATNAAVLVTEEGTKGVDVGGQLAGEAGQVIHRIALEVESGAQANVQMAAAAQQQTSGMEQIGVAMRSIQQGTTQSIAATRQAERAAQDLHRLAQSLQRAVAVYRL
ncbi:MAG TPA: methyl-accepting chemotaxis protein [Roseiflexaceae bacterium]|nr:methyl-accepting chemotaxis protein [Roseiflexaceae bacterium]